MINVSQDKLADRSNVKFITLKMYVQNVENLVKIYKNCSKSC